ARGFFCKSSRRRDQLIQFQFAKSRNLCVLPHGARDRNRRPAIALQDEHTDKGFLNKLFVSSSKVLLKLTFSATLCPDRFDKGQRTHVAVAVDLHASRRRRHLIDCDFQQIAWPKEIRPRCLSFCASRLRFGGCGLLGLNCTTYAA